MRIVRAFGGALVIATLVGGAIKAEAAQEILKISNPAYKAQYVSQSLPDPVPMKTLEERVFSVRFKNTGTATWRPKGDGRVVIFTVNQKYRTSAFYHPSWISPGQPASVVSTTAPGEVGVVTFKLKAPVTPGTYREWFSLASEEYTWVGSGRFYVDIVVTAAPSSTNAADAVEPIVNDDEEIRLSGDATSASIPLGAVSTSTVVTSRALITEPIVRVGLLKTTSSVNVELPFAFNVYSGSDFATVLAPSTRGTLSFENGKHFLSVDGMVVAESPVYLRLVPVSPTDYFVLPANKRKISGRPFDFNAYRGVLEYRFSSMSSTTVVINELPLDWYVSGITEASNGAPYEYLKALLVAARSYAYFHLNSTPPREKLFDVYASTVDQLYLGYHAELSMPNVARAARETYGQMVTYQGNPVVTPYSARTNGMTRTWKEAWGGTNKPWLVPVEAVYDKGRTRYGHGVGMSNNDAEKRARYDAWDYVTILKHYYSGTEVEKVY